MEWLVKLHTNLLAGSVGRVVNGVGGGSLTLLCLTGAIIWWPGVKYWHRSLQVKWRPTLRGSIGICIARLASSVFHLFCSGRAGFYFAFPQAFSIFFDLDPADRITDRWLFWLSEFALWAIYEAY
jgi:hypothetical protein